MRGDGKRENEIAVTVAVKAKLMIACSIKETSKIIFEFDH